MVDNCEEGIFWPQNAEYTNTSELVKIISNAHGKKMVLIKGFTWILKVMACFTKLVDKAFGNLNYEKSMSQYKTNYSVCDLEESIKRTEVI